SVGLAGPPLLHEPVTQLLESRHGVEDAADDQLGRDRPVPAVLGQTERDVVPGLAAEAVELAPEAECDRLAGVAPAVADPEPQVLAIADGRGVGDLAAVDEQRDARVAEPERCEPPVLGAAAEIEL